MSSSFSEDLKTKVINSGNQLNSVLFRIKESYDRHSERQNDYFKKYFINCENKKSEIMTLISNEITKIREIMSSSDPNRAQSLYAMNYIYDDEFVTIINSLSTSIKEFFKSTRTSVGSIKKSSDSIVDQILGSKSSISDVFMQINSCLISKYSQSKATNTVALTKEKNIKEKLNQIVEKLESINEIRSNVSKNVKFLEQNCSKFYDQAKQIFKDMKKTRNQRLDELNNLGVFNAGALNNIKSLNNQYNNIASNINTGNLQIDLQKQIKAKENNSNNNINNNLFNNSDEEFHSDGFNKITSSPDKQLLNVAARKLKDENLIISNTNTNFFNQHKKRFTTDETYNRGLALTGFEDNKKKTSLEDLDKEEKKINERIDSLKKANHSLINELKSLQQNYVNIKFENLCLKEKLDKFSNGNNDENEIENINDNLIFSERKYDFINGKSTNQGSFRIHETNSNYIIDPIIPRENRSQNKASSVDPHIKNNFSTLNRFNLNTNDNYTLEKNYLDENPMSDLNKRSTINNNNEINQFYNTAFDNKERCNSQGNVKLVTRVPNKPNNLYLNSNPNNISMNISNNFNTVDNDIPFINQNSKENYINSNPNNFNNNFKNNENQEIFNTDFNSEFSQEKNGIEINKNQTKFNEMNKILLRFKNLAEKVLEFLTNMSRLQENIQKRNPKINELKIEFELKKKELHQSSIDNVSNIKKLLENLKLFKITNTNFNDNNLNNKNPLQNENVFYESNKNYDNAYNSINISGNDSTNKKINSAKKFMNINNNKKLNSTPNNSHISTEKTNQNKSFNNTSSLNNNNNNLRISNSSSTNNSQIPKNPTKLKINNLNNNDGLFNKNFESIKSENSPILVASNNQNEKDNNLRKLSNKSFKSINDLNNSTISNRLSNKKLDTNDFGTINNEKCNENFSLSKIDKINLAEKNELNKEMNIDQNDFELDSPLLLCSAGNPMMKDGGSNKFNKNDDNKDAEKINLLEKNISEYETKFSNLTKQLEINSKELSLSEEIRSKLEFSLKNIEEKLKEEKAKLKKLMEQVIEKDNEILKLIKYKEEIEKLENKIKSMETHIADLKLKFNLQEKEFKEKINEKEYLISEYSDKITELNTRNNSNLVEIESKCESLTKQLNDLKIQKDNYEKLYKELKDKLINKERETEELNKIINELKMNKDILKNEIENLNKKINILDQEKEELVEKYTKLEDEMFIKTSELLASQNTNVEITKEISEVKSINVKLQNELDILKNQSMDNNESMKALFEKNQNQLEEKVLEIKSLTNKNINLDENLKVLNKEHNELKSFHECQVKEYEEKLNQNSLALDNANKYLNQTLNNLLKNLPEMYHIDKSQENYNDVLLAKIEESINHLYNKIEDLNKKSEYQFELKNIIINNFKSNLEKFNASYENKCNELENNCNKLHIESPNLKTLIDISKNLDNNNEEKEINNLIETVDAIFIENSNLINFSLELISKCKVTETEKESLTKNLELLSTEKLKINNELHHLKENNIDLAKDLEKLKKDYEEEEKGLILKLTESEKIIEDYKIQMEKLLISKAENEKRIEFNEQEILNFKNKLELKDKEIEINSIKFSNKLKELECYIDEKDNEINKNTNSIEELKYNLNKLTNENSVLKNKIKSLLENKISIEELSELGDSGENKLKNILEDYDRKIKEINDLQNEVVLIEENIKSLKDEKAKTEKDLVKENELRQKLAEENDLLKESLEIKLIEIKELNVIVNNHKNNEENFDFQIKKLNQSIKEAEDKFEIMNNDNSNKIDQIGNLNEKIDQLNEIIKNKDNEINCINVQTNIKISELENLIENDNVLIKEKDNIINQNNNSIDELKKQIINLNDQILKLESSHKDACENLELIIKDLKHKNDKLHIELNDKSKIIKNEEEKILSLTNKVKDQEDQINELSGKIDNLKESHKEEIKTLNEKHEDYLNSVKEEIVNSQKGESDVLKNYYENEIKNKTESYEETISKLNSDLENLEKSLNKKTQEFNNAHNEIQVFELKIHNQENHLAELNDHANKTNKELSEKINLIHSIENKLTENDKKIANLEKDLEKKEVNLKNNIIQLEELKEKLSDSKIEKDKFLFLLEELKIEVTNKEKNLEELSNNLSKAKQFENLYNESLENIQTLNNEINKLNEQSENSINLLKEEIILECSKLNEKLKDYEERLKFKQDEIVQLDNNNKKLSENIADLNKKFDLEKQSYETALESYEKKIVSLEGELKDLKNKNSIYEKELELLKEEHTKEINLLVNKHNSQLETQANEFIKQIENLKAEILKSQKELDNSKEAYDKIILANNNNVQLIMKEREKYESKIKELEENIEKLKSEFEQSEKEELIKFKKTLELKHLEDIQKIQTEMESKLLLLKEEFEKNKLEEIDTLKKELLTEKNVKLEELQTILDSKDKENMEHIQKINLLLKSIENLNEEKNKLLEDNNSKDNEIYLENEKIIQLEQLLENEKQITKILTENKIPAIETEKTTLKNQLVDIEKQYKQEAKNHSEAMKEKEIEINENQKKVNELNLELSKIRENLIKNKEVISTENDQLTKKIIELNKKIEGDCNIIEILTKEQDALKAEIKDLTEKNDANKNEIENFKKLEGDLKIENKELKNKIAKLKIEFDEINNNKINEVNSHIKSTDILNIELDKVNKEISKLLFKLQVFEDNKNFSKIKKNFESESNLNSQIKNDSFEISNTNTNNNNSHTSISKKIDSLNIDSELQQINELVENKHKKIGELIKKINELEEEKKQVEKCLSDLNNAAEDKIKDYTEENKRLKHVNDEYNKKIIEAISAKAPHLINSLEINNNVNTNSNNKNSNNEEKDFLKAIDLFKKFNDELNQINKEFEEKFLKATEKVKKYKKLYREVLSIKTNSNLNAPTEGVKSNIEIDPGTHRIIVDKEINGLRWFAVTYKDISDYEINHQNTFWVPSISIEEKLEEFNKFISEAEKIKEMNDLYLVQEELLKKLATKEEELIKIRNERDTLNKKLKLNQNYDVNNPIYENTIPLEKYQVLLNNLIEEQEKFRTAVFQIEKLRLENESLKNVVEQNKTNLEKHGGNSFSIIEEGRSQFLDDVNVIDEFFDMDKEKDKEILKEQPLEHQNNYASTPNINHNYVQSYNTNTIGNRQHHTNNTVRNTHNFDDNIERKSSLNSIRTTRKNETAGPQETVREVFAKLEDNEKLFHEQLKNVKDELKQTRTERDSYRRKFEETTTLQDGQKTELINILKQAFEKLISEITITVKNKEYIIMILRILDYSDQEINRLFNKKENGKKSILNLFKK